MMPSQLAGLLLGWLATAIHAEDIDRYLGSPGEFPAVSVLIALDNSHAATDATDWPAYADCAAGSPIFCYERTILRELGQELAGQPISLGLMLFNSPRDSRGAYLRSALSTMNTSGSADWVTRINTLNFRDDTGASPDYALALHEAYLYFQGLPARSGVTSNTDASAFNGSPRYRKPASACNRSHLVIISYGDPDSDENPTAESLLIALGGREPSDPLPLQPADHRGNWTDEYARYLRRSGITSHTFDVRPELTSTGVARSAWLRSVAKEGRGHYVAVRSIRDLQQALRAVMRDVQSASAYLSPTAIPYDPARPGVQLNHIYTGVFRPTPTLRWNGNLKHYTLGMLDGRWAWQDSNGLAAQDALSGGLLEGGLSFWTQDSDYWQYRCADARSTIEMCGNPVSVSDAPDGAVVEKGGVGQRLRLADTERVLFVCPSDKLCPPDTELGNVAETRFNQDNPALTPSRLAVLDATDRNRLIAWVRGEDNTDVPERKTGERRPSILGDAIHSRPVVWDYNRTASGCQDSKTTGQDVVVFQASNAGMIHAILAGHTAKDAGFELWGFIPQEAVTQFKRLRDDSGIINFPSVPLDENNKPYLFDGPLTIRAEDTNHDCRYTQGVDSVLLFAGMRRAGRAIYAFDITQPEHPRFLWRKDNQSPGFAELGQTWSAPVPIELRVGTNTVAALIMGAGYDPQSNDRGYDAVQKTYLPSPTKQPAMGRGVLVLAARTGEILKIFGEANGMTQAIPSDIAVLKNRDSGRAYRAYVGDAGGTVWRIDLDDPDPARWRVSEVARLGGTGGEARKFMYPPDVVAYETGHALLLGSGDSEHPFDRVVTNRFFMLKDEDGGSAIGCVSAAGSCDLADVNSPSFAKDQSRGWFLTLSAGEQVVGAATTGAGTVYFSTNRIPTAEPMACSRDTIGPRVYALNYMTAAPAWPEGVRYRETAGVRSEPFAITIPTENKNEAATSLDPTLRGIMTGRAVQPLGVSASGQKPRKVWWYKE
ncbi:MAG: pilus assembly protein [Methylococcaceae bacterium]